MSESNLKKEFNPRDVQRMRNIITGDTSARTQIQAGYEKEKQKRKEGEIWEEGGKKWTITNGVKVSVTKLDRVKDLVLMPLSCPSCGGLMKVDVYNKKMWSIHKKCFNCVIKVESEIKRLGKWDEYCAEIMNSSKNAELGYIEMSLEHWLTESDTFMSEQGEIEKWGGGNKEEIYRQVKEEITKLKSTDIYKQQNM